MQVNATKREVFYVDNILQEFADKVDGMCSDFDTHSINRDYEFYGGLTLRMLVSACKNLKDSGNVDFSEYWIDKYCD